MSEYIWLENYLLEKAGATTDYKVEWDWQRYMVDGKLFAALLHPSERYDPIYAGKDLINLKCDPMLAELLRLEYPEVLPGFYSDKRHWNSVDLDGALPDSILKQMIDDSYDLVFTKLSKKRQQEIKNAGSF